MEWGAVMTRSALRDLVLVERYRKELDEKIAKQQLVLDAMSRAGSDATGEMQKLASLKGALEALEMRARRLRDAVQAGENPPHGR